MNLALEVCVRFAHRVVVALTAQPAFLEALVDVVEAVVDPLVERDELVFRFATIFVDGIDCVARLDGGHEVGNDRLEFAVEAEVLKSVESSRYENNDPQCTLESSRVFDTTRSPERLQ